MPTLLMIALMFIGLFLILLILVQKGRGGGLAGAFGGAGGQSAFGTKAGDVFTKITIVTATVWIAVAALTVIVMAKAHEDPKNQFKKEAAETSLEATDGSGSSVAEDAGTTPAEGDITFPADEFETTDESGSTEQ